MPRPQPLSRFSTGLCAVATIAVLLTGCAPEPAPTPTPTAAFASEDEAFAAAEKTYRAYVEASNAVDLADPDSFEPVFAWLSGDALEAARKSFSRMHAEGLRVVGATQFDSFTPRQQESDSVVAELCIDVTGVDLLDGSNNSVVPPERPDRQPVQVTFSQSRTATGLVIVASDVAGEFSCSG